MKCLQCESSVLGDCIAKSDGVLHKHCNKAYEACERGLTYLCPECDGSGDVDDPGGLTINQIVKLAINEIPSCAYDGCRGCAFCRDKTKSVAVPMQVACDLCKGEGFCKQEPKPVMGITGWTFTSEKK